MYSELKTLLYIVIRSENKRLIMKKIILTILSVLILTATAEVTYAKTVNNSELVSAIKLYKAHNYTGSYSKLMTSIKKDPSNPLAYYYLAMVYTQVGNKGEALTNYDKAITLSPDGSNLNAYAKKGKLCLEDEGKCRQTEEDAEFKFMKGGFGSGFSEKARSEHERLKMENIMREINRKDDIPAQEFREFKDFSGMENNAAPTNDEIVAALRTLQRAGLTNMLGNNYSDLSLLMGSNPQQAALYSMMGNSKIDPQLIQAMMSAGSMSLGF